MKISELIEAKEKKELDLAHIAGQVYDAFKRHPNGRNVHQSNRPEKRGNEYMFDLRDWGAWEIPRDQYLEPGEEEDYDWEVMTPKTREDLGKLVKEMEKTFKGIKVSVQTGEKNWLEVYIEKK